MKSSIVQISKYLSLVLRHKPETIGISLNSGGWVEVSELLEASNAHGTKLDLDLLLHIVYENDKQRFALSPDGKSIRANQGHSVDVELGLMPKSPPTSLYHGTVSKFLDSIRIQGLMPGSRQYVHLSADPGTAEIVGKRRGRPVILVIEAERMAKDGMIFYQSLNGVWLTKHVPANYILP